MRFFDVHHLRSRLSTHQYLWKTTINKNVIPNITIMHSLAINAQSEEYDTLVLNTFLPHYTYRYRECYREINQVMVDTFEWQQNQRRTVHAEQATLLFHIRYPIVYQHHDERSPNTAGQCIEKANECFYFFSSRSFEDQFLGRVEVMGWRSQGTDWINEQCWRCQWRMILVRSVWIQLRIEFFLFTLK